MTQGKRPTETMLDEVFDVMPDSSHFGWQVAILTAIKTMEMQGRIEAAAELRKHYDWINGRKER